MAIDLAGKTVAQLETFQRNYLAQHRQADPQYLAITEELERRRSGHFDIQKTEDFLRDRARRRVFVSYKEVAEHYKMSWSAARRPLAPHLDAVCFHAHGLGWPLLSAIVVNKENLDTGKLEPDALAGFLKTAVRLNFAPGEGEGEGEAFLRDQQRQVFAWAAVAVAA